MSLPTAEIVYPESDGEPMGENSTQLKWIFALYLGFERHFRGREDVFVAANMFWYPVEGRPGIATAPDLMFAFGRPPGERSSYMQWEEGGVAPQVVFEVLSPSNTYRQRGKLGTFYDHFGVEEYYEYDPAARVLSVRRRGRKRLGPIEPLESHTSSRLGVRFEIPRGEELRVYGPNGQPFAFWGEVVTENDRAQELIVAERQRAAAEARRAAAEARRAAAEARRADDEARKAAAARHEADRMKAKLRELGIDPDAV